MVMIDAYKAASEAMGKLIDAIQAYDGPKLRALDSEEYDDINNIASNVESLVDDAKLAFFLTEELYD
jgi:hypothetical protein